MGLRRGRVSSMPAQAKWRRFFLKIRRRRVLEVVSAYIAGGWLVLEFIHHALIVHYHFSEKIFDIALVSLVAAMLSTVAWRWFNVHHSHPRKFKVELVIIPVILTGCLLLDFYLVFKIREPETDMEWKPAWKDSIVVLPFVDISGGNQDLSFCEGLSDDIMARMSDVDGLKVISRYSASRYRNSNKSISSIAKELGVNLVMTGTIRIKEERVRINVQLIDGRRGFTVWSRSYDRKAEDCFAVQEDIAGDIAAQLQLRLSKNQLIGVRSRQTNNLEAYKAFELGQRSAYNYRDHFDQNPPGDDFQTAENHFLKAIELDNKYVLAYWALGSLYEVRFARENRPEDLSRMQEWFRRAYELNKDIPETNVGLGWSYFYQKMFDLAYESFKRAYELEPGSAEINASVGSFLRSLGLYDRAVRYYLRAIDLDPLNITTYNNLINCYYYLGEYEKGLVQARKALKIEPESWRLTVSLARLLLMMGRAEEARLELDRAARLRPGSNLVRRLNALYLATRGDYEKANSLLRPEDPDISYEAVAILVLEGKTEEALKAIRKGRETGFEVYKDFIYTYPYLISSPYFQSIRGLPEFKEIQEEARLIQEEREQKYSGL